MSMQRKRGIEAGAALDEAAVADFLKTNPGFFESHAELLAQLRIPHPAGGAISLVERQMAILRQQNRQLERKLIDLVEVARANDQLMERMQRLTLALFDTADAEAVVQVVHEQLRDGFGADTIAMCLFDTDAPAPARSIARDDAALSEFRNFLEGGRPIIGKLKDAQMDYLFGDRASDCASAVLVPLGERAERGMLGIGSSRAEQFNPTMGTVYLARMGGLIGLALSHHAA